MNDTQGFTSHLFRMNQLAGLYSRIALQLGLERSHVRRVALGMRKSARVQRAIELELKRIDRKVEQHKQKAAKAA